MGLLILQNPILFFRISVLFLSFHAAKAANVSLEGNTLTDQLALLAFKSAISDPHGSLSSWRTVSSDPCNWKGVTCGPKPPKRVTALELESLQLEGSLSPSISNITFLTKLHLPYNRFHGSIPQELGRLSRLEALNLTSNSLEGGIPFCFSSLPMLQILTIDNNFLNGVIPPLLGNSTSLTYVELSANNLSGTIPEFLMNSSALEWLDLSGNHLTGGILASLGIFSNLYILNLSNNNLGGSIPPTLGTGKNLRSIDLSYNNMTQNIPRSLLNSSTLHYLNLANNGLTGKIPPILGTSQTLGYLDLSWNQLSGVIPPSLGNLSTLNYLFLGENKLEGSIPERLGSISGLIELYAPSNKLSGRFTSSFYNLSSITNIGIAQNQLYGMLLPTMGLHLPRLQILDLLGNNFEGSIPHSLCNASGLQALGLGANGFSGILPSCLGSLPSMTYIDVGWNQLHSDDMSILSSLMNCSLLNTLILEKNKLQGELPVSIGNFSMKLESLWFGANQISGLIPAEIGNLVSLTVLFMRENLFTGSIPSTMGHLSKLIQLDLSGNRLTGQIPFSLGNLTELNTLHMEDNQLSGSIPSTLGVNWRYLIELNLSHNALHGNIPNQVVSPSSLARFLDLSYNSLSGSLPFEVSSLKNLVALNVSYNQLSGEIPATLGDCLQLQYLKMENNYFHGSIPKKFSNLIAMIELDLSHNNLSGQVPEFLQKFSELNYLNLSFNNFEGEIPEGGIFTNATAVSITGNPMLCGGSPILHLKSCSGGGKSSNELKILLPIAVSVILVIFLCAFYTIYTSKKKYTRLSQSNLSDSSVTYAEIFNATNGFSNANLIGSGSFGSVYKMKMLRRENDVAVKVFNFHQSGALRSFITECQVLRNVRHRNLLKIITLCSSLDYNGDEFKALVFAYMPNGSLENWLHPETHDKFLESKRLSLSQRLNVAIDVASALDYLHNNCVPAIVHCDLKPNNILLDNNMTAIVGDFGLARILSSSAISADSSFNSTSLMRIQGSIGYVAPEYGMGNQISWQGDVYSYGVLLLELLTGKRPTDESFVQDLNLHKYVENAIPQMIAAILDPQILQEIEDETNSRSFGAHMKECLVSLFQIGLTCSSESPGHRIGIGVVVKELNSLKEKFF